MQPERERCRHEIVAIEAQLIAGHPDIEGLCMALSDWHTELSIIELRMINANSPENSPKLREQTKGASSES